MLGDLVKFNTHVCWKITLLSAILSGFLLKYFVLTQTYSFKLVGYNFPKYYLQMTKG